MKGKRGRLWLALIGALIALAGVFFGYTAVYYRADATALSALASDDGAEVRRTDYGWLFDGPSRSDALIFYPGGKVEAEAYAALAHRLAAGGVDVCLVKMPFNLAVLDVNAAERVMSQHDYASWYIGGHSLGGAMAARYAAGHADRFAGVVLCAAYPSSSLEGDWFELSLYGSEDGVLNMSKVEQGRRFAPERYEELIIEGGNHCQFGNYGPQRGDGEAAITADEQQETAVRAILDAMGL